MTFDEIVESISFEEFKAVFLSGKEKALIKQGLINGGCDRD